MRFLKAYLITEIGLVVLISLSNLCFCDSLHDHLSAKIERKYTISERPKLGNYSKNAGKALDHKNALIHSLSPNEKINYSRKILKSEGEGKHKNHDSSMFLTSPYVYDTAGFTRFNVGVLLVSGTGSNFDLEKCSPAVDMALDFINYVYLRPHKIVLDKVQKSYPSCDNSLTPGLAADMKFLSNVIAFIGPACGFALEPVARLAAYWNIPVVTGLGDQPPSTESEVHGDELLGGLNKLKINNTGVFGDKSEYPTLTRLSYCQCRLTLVFDSICSKFGWLHLAIVYDKTDLFSYTVGRILLNGLEDFGYEVYGHDVYATDHSLEIALRAVASHSRVVILSMSEMLVRDFMIKAHGKGYTNGEWVFMDVELFKNKPSQTNFWKQGENDDKRVKEAYQALLTISLLMPKSPTWNDFSRTVKHRSRTHYDYKFPANEDINFFIGAFYDGVILLGMALNETLSSPNPLLQDGRSITLKMWNRTFNGVTGNVTIDKNGDRDADYSILDMNPKTGHFEVVAHYYSGVGLLMVPNRKIRWPKGVGPPPDIPPCGFLGDDDRCAKTDVIGILPYVGAIFLVFSLLISAVIYFVFRHMKEVEAASSTRWRIYPNELTVDNVENKGKSNADEVGSSRGSVSIATYGVPTTTYVSTVYHKGVLVAVKRIQLIKRIEFTKQIVSEIRQMRDTHHENTARLVGLCLNPTDPKNNSEKWNQILVLSEYVTRGSLRDVLLNINIHLDWPFKLSLISDIVNGISYLHSNIGYHGSLRSSKCLVDARFVVKISDFGLHSLKRFRKTEDRDIEYYKKKFWTAPEHLNTPPTTSYGSYKGDIYSMGIILHEVTVRAIPYASIETMTPEEIVGQVALKLNPPFRPEVNEESCSAEIHHLMQSCWADNPDERPDISNVKHTLKKLMKGSVHLVDDLLRRLEQHASHLEVLVDDKTRELEQEKKRSEELLYQVLPRQVAEQLLQGETVIPESFDAVTIYFSDIVGFTAICAKSTPIEVVDFLNHLYGTFDRILDSFDAYKVETIGDAYMVVSGAPQRNGDIHVTEIAYLSLAVLDTVRNYEIDHLPKEQLKIRIGIHTGPICAGVVGHRMPHYCLFGDTVNTASRMESSGLPLKIHVSEQTARILEKSQGFLLTPRGEVLLKGKGVTRTFWLEGCEDETKWKRVTNNLASGSVQSLNTKCSTSFSNCNHSFPNNHFSCSPSNNVTNVSAFPVPEICASSAK